MTETFELQAAMGRRQLSHNWCQAKDGDEFVRQIYDRHYSRYRYADGRQPKLFVGPGEKIVLVTSDGSAIWSWRKFRSDDGQDGVNNAIFRNEGAILSSRLILEAEQIGWRRWP